MSTHTSHYRASAGLVRTEQFAQAMLLVWAFIFSALALIALDTGREPIVFVPQVGLFFAAAFVIRHVPLPRAYAEVVALAAILAVGVLAYESGFWETALYWGTGALVGFVVGAAFDRRYGYTADYVFNWGFGVWLGWALLAWVVMISGFPSWTQAAPALIAAVIGLATLADRAPD